MTWQSNLYNTPSNSLLVSTARRRIVRLHCPVPARCITSVAGIEEGDIVSIEAVADNRQFLMLYQIDGLFLPYQYFTII